MSYNSSKSGMAKVKDAFENFPENLGKTLDVTAGATWRAGSAALDYKGFAEAGEDPNS